MTNKQVHTLDVPISVTHLEARHIDHHVRSNCTHVFIGTVPTRVDRVINPAQLAIKIARVDYFTCWLRAWLCMGYLLPTFLALAQDKLPM